MLLIQTGEAMASALGEMVGVRRNLALCSTGYWIIAGIGGDGYPVFGVRNFSENYDSLGIGFTVWSGSLSMFD